MRELQRSIQQRSLFRLATLFRHATAVGLMLWASGLVGCGYTLVGLASNIPEDVREVYLETLENTTQRAQVEQILSQAIANELVTRPRLNVVNSQDAADAILRGKVLGFVVRPLTFDEDGLASNFEIEITADMVFQRVPQPNGEEGAVIWRNSRYLFRQDYPLEDASGNFFDREIMAIEETSERFAETLITDLLEGF